MYSVAFRRMSPITVSAVLPTVPSASNSRALACASNLFMSSIVAASGDILATLSRFADKIRL